MKDLKPDIEARIKYIREKLKESGCKGIIFGNSGGKDCALTGILSKMACDDTVGVIMPCCSKVNYGKDFSDAKALAEKFSIETRIVDLSEVREKLIAEFKGPVKISDASRANMAPRLRMLTLYTIAQSEGRLVAGTGNRSERYMGYFTKWGDGAFDFNPVADLTVSEVYEYLRYLKAPESIVKKVPSAGLFDGQTDEKEMGVSYKAIDEFLLTGKTDEASLRVIERYHRATEHKRLLPSVFMEL